MANQKQLRVRRSLRELENDYNNGKKEPLEKLVRAWKGIQELPPDDPRSFFNLGGFHGEPFRGAGWGWNFFWGGYCNHGNVLFPTWHRVYCLKVEEALQSIPGCEDVMLPYWDETDEESLTKGVPWSLTQKKFELDGKEIHNPLYSFKFPVTIPDNLSGDNNLYTKYKGYHTVRYPLSGLEGTPEQKAKSEAHNARFTDEECVRLLNRNVVAWLNGTAHLHNHKDPDPVQQRLKISVYEQYKQCLKAPNYTVFSNTTSAQQWNEVNDSDNTVVPLEQPHNDVHLAVGGFDVPGQADFSPITGANGDMGENNTAGLDPIFYFHHCNVDRMFWVWQKQNGYTDHLEIIPEYPGTNTSDNQGPTPGVPGNAWLNLTSPLTPFVMKQNGAERPYTSEDCINIETQLGFTYSIGSLDGPKETLKARAAAPKNGAVRKLRISRINRAPIGGSFIIAAYATINGKEYYLGHRSVLSRWSVTGCANCMTHLEVKAFFDLDFLDELQIKDSDVSYRVEVIGREHSKDTLNALVDKKLYRLEVR
jgi:tyrosinase